MKTNKLWNMILLLIFVLGTVISLSSCDKNDDNSINPTTNTNTNTNSLLVGKWRYGAMQKTWEFKSDNSFHEWGIQYGTHEYNAYGSYTYYASEKLLVITFNDGYVSSWTVVKVDNTALIVQDNDGKRYTYNRQ